MLARFQIEKTVPEYDASAVSPADKVSQDLYETLGIGQVCA